MTPALERGIAASARRILPLAWPVLVGQVSVLAFATVDTLLVARYAAADLAALAVGSAAYITVFIGLMGVVLGLGPLVGQAFGAGQLQQAGRQAHQGVWVALTLSLAGSTLLAFPTPFLALARAPAEVEPKVRQYLLMLAFSLPASLLFTVYRGFNNAVSRPKAVMVLQLAGLGLKIPLSAGLVWGVPALGVPALGVQGCGLATAIAMWAQLLAAVAMVRGDPFYARFSLAGRGLDAPDRRLLGAHLRMGLPMGGSILIEVTAFSFMAIFISRLGTTAVAGHQIAVNVVTLMFMVPLALGNATGALVAQQVGARQDAAARQLAVHGLVIATAISALMGAAVSLSREPLVGLYTRDVAIAAAALPLMTWVAVFHVADAVQTVAAFVLRGWRIATVPLVIYGVSLWGLGLGGGIVIGFDLAGVTPAALQGARGFWFASTTGLVIAAVALALFLGWVIRAQRRRAEAASADAA